MAERNSFGKYRHMLYEHHSGGCCRRVAWIEKRAASTRCTAVLRSTIIAARDFLMREFIVCRMFGWRHTIVDDIAITRRCR